ncbi:MAG TPA: N-glycosylase/DNA lyase [Pyrinomonadaceae bacterium]
MQRNRQLVTVESIRVAHQARRQQIQARLAEFQAVWLNGSDARLWEELAFCIFTAGASARMGLKAVEAVRPFLQQGRRDQMTRALKKAGAHRFPVARPGYIVETRRYLRNHCGMQLRQTLNSFASATERRDWLAGDRRIKGLGYKEASHFLRNIGLMGHAILDKHVLRCLADVGVVDTPEPPGTRRLYLQIEESLKRFADDIGINFDELDLVLWSMKTGEILK